jgi:hypothetical protein
MDVHVSRQRSHTRATHACVWRVELLDGLLARVHVRVAVDAQVGHQLLAASAVDAVDLAVVVFWRVLQRGLQGHKQHHYAASRHTADGPVALHATEQPSLRSGQPQARARPHARTHAPRAT